MGIRCADHVTPLYPQKLALTSPTGGGRSVGIVRSRTKATEEYLDPAARKFRGIKAPSVTVGRQEAVDDLFVDQSDSFRLKSVNVRPPRYGDAS